MASITTFLAKRRQRGLGFSQQLLVATHIINRPGNQFAEGARRWKVRYAYGRLDEISGNGKAPDITMMLCAAIDCTELVACANRTGRPDEKEFHAHLHSWQALCHILRFF
ncbi:DUF5682 family protein, partial [Shigella flexneri]